MGRPLRIASIDQQQIPQRRSQGPGGEATELDDRRRRWHRCYGHRCHGHGCHGHRRQGQGHGEDSGCFFSATTVTMGY